MDVGKMYIDVKCITAKKDLLYQQLYFSPELQLLTWFYGKILE